jgi:hypothetical protein
LLPTGGIRNEKSKRRKKTLLQPKYRHCSEDTELDTHSSGEIVLCAYNTQSVRLNFGMDFGFVENVKKKEIVYVK